MFDRSRRYRRSEKVHRRTSFFSRPAIANVESMSTLTEFGTNDRRPASRQIQAPACPPAGPKPACFYYTMPPSRNVRNPLKTNNWCIFYSTINRGVSSTVFYQLPITTHQSLRGFNG